MPVYLELFHGRKDPEAVMDDWGEEGPIFGPYAHAHTTYQSDIRMGDEKGTMNFFTINDKHGLVFYDGVWYGDWSVFADDVFSQEKDRIGSRLIEYDSSLADPIRF